MSKYNIEYARSYYEKNKEKIKERSRKREQRIKNEDPINYYKYKLNNIRKWRERNPEIYKAYSKVFIELRAGRIRRKPCEVCCETISQAHHEDYTKPLEIIWLCKLHHVEYDNLRRKRENSYQQVNNCYLTP